MKSVYLWRDVMGLTAYSHRGMRDLQKIASVDAGRLKISDAIALEPLKVDSAVVLEPPDFPFTPGNTLRLASRRAIGTLGKELFLRAGAFLPCEVQGANEYYDLFACALVGGALGSSANFDGLKAKFDFAADRIPEGVPFVEERNGRRLLFVDSVFKMNVEEHRLTGIRFEKVWSQEEGAFEYRLVDGTLSLVRTEQ